MNYIFYPVQYNLISNNYILSVRMRILGVYVCLLIIGLCCAVSWGLNPINVSYLVIMLTMTMLLLLLFRAAFCHCWDKTTFLEMLLFHVAIITNANTGTLQWQYYFYIYTSSGECCRWCRSTRGRSYSGWGGCSVAAPRGQVTTLNRDAASNSWG